MNIYVLLTLIWTHYAADFIFQTDDMARRKSTSNWWLSYHVLVYMALFIPFGLGLKSWSAVCFIAINFVTHWLTDYVTSRVTAGLWEKALSVPGPAGYRHGFWIVIGIDQALHLTALTLTFQWLGGR